MHYVRSLDGLRGVAVLAVLCMHAAFATPVEHREATDVIAFSVLRFGWLGVDCFFVLSGFLITSILLSVRDGGATSSAFANFYARRALRIFPIYYLYLGVLALPVGQAPAHTTELTWLATYTQNVFWPLYGSQLWPWVGHLWSLAIEEHFYLIWPWIVLCVTPRNVPRLIVVTIIGVIALRIAAFETGWGGFVYMSTLTRMDSLLVGALLSYARAGFAPSLAPWLLSRPAWLVVGCFSLYLLAQLFAGIGVIGLVNQSVGYTLFAFGCAGVIGNLTGQPSRCARPLEHSSIVAVGRVSYGVYIYHMPVFVLLKVVLRMLHPAWQTGSYLVDFCSFMLVGTAVTLGIAAVSYRLIERPLLRLKPARSSAATGAAEFSSVG